MQGYRDDFSACAASFAIRSAQKVVPIVQAATGARSVADFGCGQGAWLSVWKEAGAEVRGIDGPSVVREKLLIPQDAFSAMDLAKPIDLERRFDLAQSLETAEHLPSANAAGFVAALAAHSDHVLFSAAVPGQGGEHHVNAQKLEYWRALFRAQGYLAVDLVRPALRDDTDVNQCYRCNAVLYTRQMAVGSLSEQARAYLVPDDVPLSEYWPLRDRIQQTVMRQLPAGVVDWIARMNVTRYVAR